MDLLRLFPFWIDFSIGPSFEVVVAGDPVAEDTRAMLRNLRQNFIRMRGIISTLK